MDIKKMFVGRIGRKQFLTGSAVLALINIVVMIPLGIAMKSLVMYSGVYHVGRQVRFADFQAFGALPILPMILAGAICFISFVIYLSLVVRRLHDFDQIGWWSLFSLISPASLILFLVLIFRKGDQGDNKYGSALKAPVSWKKLYLNAN